MPMLERKMRGFRIPVLVLAVLALALLLPARALAFEGEAAHTIPLYVEVVERFFVMLTAAVVAFGILHVEIEILHWAWLRFRGRGRQPASSSGGKGTDHLPIEKVKRFDIHQRIQHFLLMSSFIALAVTGIPQKFYRFDPFADFIALMGGMDGIRLAHRVSAGVMVFAGFYHLLYLIPGLVTLRGGVPTVRPGRWLEMLPNLKDVQDFVQMMGYFLGVRPSPPRFGRFSYLQKFDYWAVFWGLTIMAVSGAIMMFPIIGIKLGGTAVIAASLAAHSDEAILAIGWIFIVHIYHAHLKPVVFPFNTTIFTGKIPLRLLQEEHPLEYARVVMDIKQRAPAKERREETPVRGAISSGDS